MSTQLPRYQVRAVHCDHRASDEQVYAALRRATGPLEQAWTKLRQAERICVKFNQAWPPDRLVLFEGQHQQLVSEQVARATLRLLREETRAELVCAEISVFKHDRFPEPGLTISLLPLLREFEVEFVDGNLPPHKVYPVPGGGYVFRQYILPQRAADADAFVRAKDEEPRVHGCHVVSEESVRTGSTRAARQVAPILSPPGAHAIRTRRPGPSL